VSRGVPSSAATSSARASISARCDAADPVLRARLGFGEGDHVVLAAGESTRNASHTDAAWTVAILHIFDPKYRLAALGSGRAGSEVHRLSESQ
jgi:hypothetical protein